MKFGLALLAVVFLGLAATACSNSPVTSEYGDSAIGDITTLEKVALVVPTISWAGCEPRVEASAKSVPGVREVRFDDQNIQKVTVIYDPAETTVDAIVEAIESRGDTVTEIMEWWCQPFKARAHLERCTKYTTENQEPDMLGIKNKSSLIGRGILGGLIGSACCVLPAVAIAIGLSGGIAATLVGLGKFRIYGLIAGLAFIAIASWFSVRRSRRCCTGEEYRRRRIIIPLTMLVSFGIVYGLAMYIITPLLYRID